MIDDLDIRLLKALYELNFNFGKKLIIKELGFESTQHAAYLLFKIQKLGYIDFDERKAFITGGIKHEKYNNNVVVIWAEEIDILEKGIQEIKNICKHY